MSLYRQLWIAIVLLMLVIFGTTFVVNGYSSSRYLEEQLSIKNSDDAAALALSLSQQSLDPVALEIQLASQLDHGSYESVEFQNADGSPGFSRNKRTESSAAPTWLRRIFPIEAAAGTATVNSGWTQLGTLTLRSHDDFAYQELWSSAKRTLAALLAAIVIAGGLGSLLLRAILRPLDQVVEQAVAMGERRFVSLPEPATREFAKLTQAMNTLAERVRDMLGQDAERLRMHRESTDIDALTGLEQREPFLARLALKLQSDNADSDGSLALCRIHRLSELNQMHGRRVMDALLANIGAGLNGVARQNAGWVIAHINASDFIILAPQEKDPAHLGGVLKKTIEEAVTRHAMAHVIELPCACTSYHPGETASQLMTELDESLMLSAHTDDMPVTLTLQGEQRLSSLRDKTVKWDRTIRSALTDSGLRLAVHPTVSGQGALIHEDAQLELRSEHTWFGVDEVMPWAHRLALSSEIDCAVVDLGIARIRESGHATCISLSFAALSDNNFLDWLRHRLTESGDAALHLRASVTEAAAFTNPSGFTTLQHCLRAQGGQLGISQVGHRVSDVSMFGDLGADYLKIDRVFVHGIEQSPGKQALLQIYARIASSLGVPCIADDVKNDAEREAALRCGIAAVTGPGISER
jgi:EAL domain-containing protein (putative c-di-GMP-specific phosphodiesterase class I)